MTIHQFYLNFLVFFTTAFSAVLTHGPMVGHTTNSSTQIWVRADGQCDYTLRLYENGTGRTILSPKLVLGESANFCGTLKIDGLSPSTVYRYDVLLNERIQNTCLIQEFKTFPLHGEPGISRIGFGHSVRGSLSPQTTWKAIKEKNPDLFILMGDNIYSDSTDPAVQRPMFLKYRQDPFFLSLGSTTPIYAVWDDHDYGANNSDCTQPGKERALGTFFELWPNPPSAAKSGGIWSRFVIGQSEFFLLDVRYHRSPDDDPDEPDKTMLGKEQLDWFKKALAGSRTVFKFPVSGSSWNCGGVESWNHRYTYEYDHILEHIKKNKVSGIILLGGDQHNLKIGVRPGESWGGYDLHEWMAGQIWNRKDENERRGRGFGIITVNTKTSPAYARVEFFDERGELKKGTRVIYTGPGALRAMWNSPPNVGGVKPPRSVDGELRPATSGSFWDSLPKSAGETLTKDDLRFK